MYIRYYLTFFIYKTIVCQNTGKKSFLLYHPEDVLTKLSYLLLSF